MTFSSHILQRVGEVLVEHRNFIYKIVGTATIAKPVPSHHLVVLHLDLPAFNLSLIEQVNKVLLIVAVVIERERKRLTGSIHTRLRKVQSSVPRVPDQS